MSREITNRLIDFAEETGAWEVIARMCLSYMSEDDVADMNRVAEFVPRDDNEDDACPGCGCEPGDES